MSDWDFGDMMLHALMGLCAGLMVGLVLFLGAAGVDELLAVRAERKAIACAVRRMDHRRVPFTTEVTCVPKALDTRSDTLTIQR